MISDQETRSAPIRRVFVCLVSLTGMLLTQPQSLAAVQGDTTSGDFFHSAGVRIRYVDRGSGQPVVLLHGYTGNVERHLVTTGVIPSLETHYRVIAPDLRGHGASDKPHEPSAYGAEMGRDVIRLLDHLGVERAHIVGYSLGAHIVAGLLTVHPERFATATFAGAAPSRSWTREQAEAAEVTALELEGDTPFRLLILRLTPADQPNPSEETIRSISKAITARNDVRALAAFQRGFHGLVVTDEQIATVRVPVLAVIGTDDHNLGAMKELKTVLPQLELVVVEGATHGGERGILGRREFIEALQQFMEANRIAR